MQDTAKQRDLNQIRFLGDTYAKIIPSSVSFLTQSHITFTGIQSTQDVYKIELFNYSQQIELKILKKYSDSIKCYFTGGVGGSFKGSISYSSGNTVITQNQIDIRVKINSITPNQGNYKGGVILTIKGENFSFTINENQVFIGDIQCDVFQSTDQEIKCITRPALSFQGQKSSVNIKFGSLSSMTDNTTNIDYKFINVQQQQPMITKLGSNQNDLIMGETVIIEGTNLFAEGQQTILFFGEKVLNYQKTQSGLSFVVPYDLMKKEYEIVIYVGQNGQTEVQQIKIMFQITKLLCLNPDNLIVRNHNDFLIVAMTTGVKTNSIIQFMYNNNQIQQGDLIQNQSGFIKFGYSSNFESIEQILIDEVQMLQQPFYFSESNQSIYGFQFDIKTHPNDQFYFQVTLKQNQNPNIDIYEMFIIYDYNYGNRNFYLMTKENKNIFKFKKFEIKQGIQILFCSNFGYNYIHDFEINFKEITMPQQKAIRLSHQINVQSGDILKFKIPNPNFQQTAMYVLCSNNDKYLIKVNLSDFESYESKFLSELKYSKDIYLVYPYKQEGDIFEYKIPTILIRPNSSIKQCDIVIHRDYISHFIYKSQIQNQQMEYEQFLFLDELQRKTDKDSDYDKENPYSNSLGSSYSLFSSSILGIFLDAIIPKKENIYVIKIEPNNLSSYGGERVIITGANFLANNNNIFSIKVLLQGVQCNVQTVSNSEIVCISGEKMFYNIIEIGETTITTGNSEAFMFFTLVRYVFDFSDKVKLRYFNNEFVKSKNLYIPSYYGVVMDISQVFSEDYVRLGTISVDGILFLKNSRDQAIFIEKINGDGEVLIGTEKERINYKVEYTINQLSVKSFSAYGKKFEKYSYNLKQSPTLQSDEIQLEEDQIFLNKNDKILVLSTSMDENNEEFVVNQIVGNKIKVDGQFQFSHRNILETHKLSSGDDYQFNIKCKVLYIDRNLKINIISSQNLKNIVDTELNFILNFPSIKKLVNSIIRNLQALNIYINSIQGSIIFSEKSVQLSSKFMEDSYLLKTIENMSSELTISLIGFQQITNNFIQFNVIIYSYHPDSAEISRNIIVKSDICIIFYSLQVIMNKNICFSVNSMLKSINSQGITTNGIAIAGLDIRKQLIIHQPQYYQRIQQLNTDSWQIKFFAVANTYAQPNKNQPILFLILKNLYYYYNNDPQMRILQNFEISGFGLANQDQLIISDTSEYKQPLHIIIFNKFKSDISQNNKIFNPSILAPLILIDQDGSLTGIRQVLVSSSNIFPKLNVVVNSSNQNTVTNQIGVILVKPSSQSRLCDLQRERILEVDGQRYNSIDYFVISQEDITTFRFLEYDSKVDKVPCSFSLSLFYQQDTSKSIILKYKIDLSQFDVQLFSNNFSLGKRIDFQRITSQVLSQNCQHGQYTYESDGVLICFQKLNDDLSVFVLPRGFYPYIIPKINNSQSSIDKNFLTESDWKDGIFSTRLDKRWTILENWNMVLSTGGEHFVPSLDILGTLTIDLQEKSATIKTAGISISGGQIIIKSGIITFEFIDNNSEKPIFVNFLENKSYFAKPFLIFGKFISNSDDQMQELQTFRVTSIDQTNKKIITVLQLTSSDYFRVGDTLIITSPITSESKKTQINKIISPYNSSTKTITIELDQEYLYSEQLIQKTYLSKEFDFRPLVNKVNRQIIIKNANIFIRSYKYSVIPQVNFVGIQFIDSIIEISKKFKEIFIKNSSFISVNQPINVYISVNGPTLQTSGNPEIYTEYKIQFNNNFFYASQKHIQISRFYYVSYYIDISDYIEIINDYSYSQQLSEFDSQQLNIINLEKNVLINASYVSIDTAALVNMKENTIIKSGQSCLKSYFCPITYFDQFYDCGYYGILSDICDEFKNVVVVNSNSFSSAEVASYTQVVSIENIHHFNFNPKNYFDKSKIKLKTLISQSAIVFNLFKQNSNCQHQILLSYSFDQSVSNYFSGLNLISDIEVSDFKCSQNAIVKIMSQSDIYPFINIHNSICKVCEITVNDIIQINSNIKNIPDSFRVQDTTGNFINYLSNKPLAYIKNDDSFNQIEIEKPLNALFIKQINISPDTVKSYYKLNDYQFNAIPSFQNYAIGYLQSNQQYSLTADKQLKNILISLESYNGLKQYALLKIKAQENYQLIIKDQLQLPVLPTPFNIDSPSTDLLKLVGNDISKLKCGMNIQDKDTQDNFIIITSEDDCQLYLSEVQSTKIRFKIATPILPPPTPEEEGMCDADRRVAYIVLRISNLLGIEKSRVRLLGRSQAACASGTRFLQQKDSTDEYIFIIDPASSQKNNDDLNNYSTDPEEKKDKDVLDMVNVINNINNLLLQNQADQGFKIENLEIKIPQLDTSNLCEQGQLSQEGRCVESCSSNFYASGSICFACYNDCNGCTGSTKFDCKECKDGKTKLVESSNKSYCGQCSENCRSCINEVSCSECTQNYFMNEQKCVLVCPVGKFESGNKCEVCPIGCKTCQSESVCTSCTNGKTLNSSQQCVDNTSPKLPDINQNNQSDQGQQGDIKQAQYQLNYESALLIAILLIMF